MSGHLRPWRYFVCYDGIVHAIDEDDAITEALTAVQYDAAGTPNVQVEQIEQKEHTPE